MSSRARSFRVVVGLLAACAAACSESKPAESPETTASSSEADAKSPAGKGDKGDIPASPGDKGDPPADPGSGAPQAPAVPKGLAMDTYEMTPSDCNALGRHYGEVARSDQMAQLSPKVSEKQRQATADQVDKVVGKLEDNWTNGCQSTLVNKAVDHDAIVCALKAKTVHDFDVCLNGAAGTPQPAAKPGKKNK